MNDLKPQSGGNDSSVGADRKGILRSSGLPQESGVLSLLGVFESSATLYLNDQNKRREPERRRVRRENFWGKAHRRANFSPTQRASRNPGWGSFMPSCSCRQLRRRECYRSSCDQEFADCICRKVLDSIDGPVLYKQARAMTELRTRTRIQW